MPRILFDNDVDWGLRGLFRGQGVPVETAKDMGWAELDNGDLLNAARSAVPPFDAMVTRDGKMRGEQEHRNLAFPVIYMDYRQRDKQTGMDIVTRHIIPNLMSGSLENRLYTADINGFTPWERGMRRGKRRGQRPPHLAKGNRTPESTAYAAREWEKASLGDGEPLD